MGTVMHCALLLFILAKTSGLAKYECTDTTGSTIPLQLVGPDDRIELFTPNYPNPFKNKWLDCVWEIHGLHGTRVQVKLAYMGLNEACNDNILTVTDDSSKGSGSKLESPGLTARCGQSTFPPANEVVISEGVVTVRFKSRSNSGNSLFRLEVSGAIPNACPAKVPLVGGCPYGPCCSGEDCCFINVGNLPEKIQSPEFPAPSKPGLDCQYTFATATGSQIALNFLSMDIRTDSNQACLSDYIVLEDPTKSPSSLIGQKKTLCGQMLPNYPAPSILVSAGNILKLKYHTDSSKSIKGSGFKATVTAINPTCNTMQFEYQYGEETCNSTCGVPYVEKWTRESRTRKPTPSTSTSTESTTSHLVNPTCEEKDVVYEGNVLSTKEDVQTWEECAHACWLGYDCTHFSWTPDKSCSAKSTLEGKSEQPGTVSGNSSCGELATPKPTPTGITPTGVTPATTTTPELIHPDCIEEGRFYDSVDGQKQIKNIKSWQECAYLCQLDPECKGFTWVSPAFLEATKNYLCGLKPELVIGTAEGGPESKIVGFVRGKKECGEFVSSTLPPTAETTTRPLINPTCQLNDTHHKGTPLKSVEDINSWEHCAHTCRTTNECTYWSYFTESFVISTMVGQCDLQKSDEGHREGLGVVSGSAECGEWITTTPQPETTLPLQNKTCGEVDEDITGAPIKIIHGIDSWEHCAYLCNKDNKCQFWTWTSSRFPLDSFVGDCDLKERDQGRRRSTGIVSGTSDCGSPTSTVPPSTVPTTTPNQITETIPPKPTKCSVVHMVIKVIDKSTRDPVSRANVTIRSKKVYLGEDISSQLATHITDGNGKVTEDGKLFGTYTISVLKVTDVKEFRETIDLTIGEMNTTCENPEEGCTHCKEEIELVIEPEVPTDNCTCKGDLLVNSEIGQYPIPDVCVSYSFERSSSQALPSGTRVDIVDVNRQLSLGSINSEEPQCKLKTDINGRVHLDTTHKIGTYTLTFSHDKFDTRTIKTSVGIDTDNCNCDFKLDLNMTNKVCTNEDTPVNLKVFVRNYKTSEYIDGATVFIKVAGLKEKTDENGAATFPITDNGRYGIEVEAAGMNEEFKVEDIYCDRKDCGNCNPVVNIWMVPVSEESTIPPTDETCDSEKPLKQQVFIVTVDNQTNSKLSGVVYSIAVNGKYVAKELFFQNPGIAMDIKENGLYLVKANAEGYKASEEEVSIYCSNKECKDCLHTITVRLEPDVCEETDFTVSVRDVISNSPIEGATVRISGLNPDFEKETDVDGLVVVVSPGKANLSIEVEKDGYFYINDTKDIFCAKPCGSCNPELNLKIKKKFCEENKVGLEITVKDDKSYPISGAMVLVEVTSTDSGSTVGLGLRVQVLRTTYNGTIVAPIFETGTYLVRVSADNYAPMSQEVAVDNTTNCENVPMLINLVEESEGQFCKNGLITVYVEDKVTKETIPEAKVSVASEKGFSAVDVRVREDGKAYIPVTTDGRYEIEVSMEGHKDGKSYVNIDFPKNCKASVSLVLEEKTCPNTIMPVRVTDNVTDKAVPNALVKVILVETLKGKTFTELDEPKYTDDNGTAYFNVPMNGEYKVEVTVDGYETIEVPKDVHCNVDHCEGCAPNVVVIVHPSFCPEKSLKLIIMDCITNALISGATVDTTLDTVGTEYTSIKVDSSISADSGEVIIPLSENGMYNSVITVEGYGTIMNSFEAKVDKDQCDVFNPVDTVPICPPAKPGCTRVTLAWANDKDIDLNGFRVNKTNTNDTCTTKPSCCDHCKKEDCPGVTPSIDDEDGLNGTETITYCNTSDYTNMLYISDPTGEGEFLPTSGAKIVITLGEREQVIRLDDISRPEGAKYWLAGCLTTKEASFDFITINKFFDTKPDDEDSLLCFDRVKEAEESLSNIVLKNAQLEVNFYDADTKDPIVGAMADASTLTESISRLSKVDGKSTIKITKNGEYIIDATAEGYVGAENAVTVECPVCKTIGKTNPGRNCVFPFSFKGKVYNKCAKWGLKFWCGFQYEFKNNEWGFCDPSVCPTGAGKACTETVAFSMVPEGQNDKVEIVLNWGDQADNLDLHTIQVHNQVSNNWCETYFGKKSGCSLTELDQDIKNGGASGGEKITISPLGKVPYTYMIVVKDNSAYKNQLDNSEGSIHISDGVRSLSRSLPNFGSGTPEGAYYWFVGCLRIVDKSFVFSPVDKLARQSPYVTERLYCNDLFKENPSAGIKPYDQFCNDVTMNVRFTIPNNQRGSPAKINIISVDNSGEEKIILAKTVKYWSSVVKTPITTNGKYIVKVEGEGYTSTENQYIVRCKKLDCKTCKPSFVVPLITVPNNEDQVKIILSWTGPSNALIAKSQVVDSSIAMEQCYSTSQNKSTCYSTKSTYEDNYFELEEFSKLLAGKAGTVLVKLSDALASAKPDARVTITDSKRTVTARVNMQDYQGEDYWLPFCIFTDGETFRLYGGPVFFNKASLDTYSQEYCARGF